MYECCGFGGTLHEELGTAGAQWLITTPMRLSLERKRKNDRLDARELEEGLRAGYVDENAVRARILKEARPVTST